MIIERVFQEVDRVLPRGGIGRIMSAGKPVLEEARARLIATGMIPAERSGFGWLAWVLILLCLAAACCGGWLLLRKKEDD